MVGSPRDGASEVLLETKLFPPRWRGGLVARPLLVDRLERGVESRLTLVSAPAGSGKTTLLGEWLARRNAPVAWLSLDQGDGDPTRFWSYTTSAAQATVPLPGGLPLLLGALGFAARRRRSAARA